jgi:hypothetical protein
MIVLPSLHEAGHVWAAVLTGGTVTGEVLHMFSDSVVYFTGGNAMVIYASGMGFCLICCLIFMEFCDWRSDIMSFFFSGHSFLYAISGMGDSLYLSRLGTTAELLTLAIAAVALVLALTSVWLFVRHLSTVFVVVK